VQIRPRRLKEITMPDRTDAQIATALKDARGLVAVAARKLGITRQTIYNRRKTSEVIEDAITEAREFTTDVAEAKLFQAIESGEAWAVCFYLKCQGKGRGYVEKQQVEHSGTVNTGVLMVPESPENWHKAVRESQANLTDSSANRVAALAKAPKGNGKKNGDGP